MKQTNYAGIDYGLGKTNIDPDTGIRYGVIPLNDVLSAWVDSSESHYTPACPKCGNELDPDELNGDYKFKCPHCRKTIREDDIYGESPDYEYIDDGEYTATLDSEGDIFITKSPYYTFAQFCSPCAPGAGYLRTYCPNGPKTFCFDHSWFYDNPETNGQAPYPVFRVSDDSPVLKETKE